MDSKVKKEEKSLTSSLGEIPSIPPEEETRAKSVPAPVMESSSTVMVDIPPTHRRSHPHHPYGTKNLPEILKKKNKTMNRQWRKIKKLEKQLEQCKAPRPVQQDANVILLRAEVARLGKELLMREQSLSGNQEYISYLQTTLRDYRGQFHEAQEKHLQETQAVQHLEDQLSQTEEGYQGAMQKLQADIETLQNNNKKLTSQLMEQKASIAKAKSLTKAGKVSDDAILSLWKKMKYNIHNMASTILTECPSYKEIEANIKDSECVLSLLNARIYGFLQDEDTRSSVVEMLIWDMLLREVFKPYSQTLSGVCWGSLEGECFSLMVEGMAEIALEKNSVAKSFFQWKAEGARMIEDMVGVDKKKVNQIADDYSAIFHLFVPRHGVHHHAAMEKLFKNFCKVMEDALSLQSIFMTSKAHFKLDRPHTPGRGRLTRYDGEWMDAESWIKEPLDKRSSLKFPISPGLVKYGTADGEHYDQQLRLIKVRVACN